MFEETLDRIASQIMAMDEASLAELLPKYKKIMDNFNGTREWEKSVIIYFLINSVRVKNSLFQEEMRRRFKNDDDPDKTPPKPRSLKLVKP